MPFGRTGQWIGVMAGDRCCYCGAVTGSGRFDGLGRYQCDYCREWQAKVAEATRLARVADEVREREAMWGLTEA
jgi:hypothetical protein